MNSITNRKVGELSEKAVLLRKREGAIIATNYYERIKQKMEMQQDI